MNVCLTGWNGFLSKKLRIRNEINWVQDIENSNSLFLMGSPTFTQSQLLKNDAVIMHQYVLKTIDKIKDYKNKIIFASTTGVDDISLDHTGSTAYNLSKLYIENYIINHCEDYLILRIGTIISKNVEDIRLMKPDRLQQRILNKDFKDIPFEDYYLDVESFIDKTIRAILNNQSGILHYDLEKYTLPNLIKIGTRND